MNENGRRLLAPLVLALATGVVCAGCFLFHKDPAYGKIHADAKAGDATAVAADLAANPGSINSPDDAGLTPLHLASLQCHTNVIAVLLSKGADINRKAKDDATALHLAAQEGCVDAVQMLVANRAKVNPQDSQGRTPLKRAELWHQDAVADFLRQHGGTEGSE